MRERERVCVCVCVEAIPEVNMSCIYNMQSTSPHSTGIYIHTHIHTHTHTCRASTTFKAFPHTAELGGVAKGRTVARERAPPPPRGDGRGDLAGGCGANGLFSVRETRGRDTDGGSADWRPAAVREGRSGAVGRLLCSDVAMWPRGDAAGGGVPLGDAVLPLGDAVLPLGEGAREYACGACINGSIMSVYAY